ncbi:VOC family protein [Kaistia algarum]|uniref:glyoxalase superfamily protein n=1 Tax=Kaistia algarum TaxID=2083279 RepID=UPI000CE73432|nr:glyoxalase superfamily protein [Kaistia algarum]MCX5512484.1 glyoxalase superfamily protein [Kaistia algarum]PPE80560.1 VOC family protein [Kaistia algarum]
MRDFRDAKTMAKELRAEFSGRGVDLTHSETLELIARQFGLRDWNALSAALVAGVGNPGPVVREVIPILRIFSVDKAREFYEGFLGFTFDWEHRYEPGLPLYAEVSRAGMKLHLSEHHGDASPGSTVFVWMTGIRTFHRELTEKVYGYSRPGLQETGYGALMVEVPDPFGNRIRFNERL